MKYCWLFFLLSGRLLAANWYLDKAASGANNGTSPTNAWQSASAAMAGYSAMASNDTLLIQGGDYSTEQLDIYFPSKSGITFKIYPTATQQAVFKASRVYQGDACAWDGYLNGTQMIKFVGNSNFSPAYPVVVELTSHFTFTGIEVDGTALDPATAYHGIHLNGTVDHVTIDHCYLHVLGGDGVNANTSVTPTANTYDNLVVTNTTIYYVGGDGCKTSKGSVTYAYNNVNNAGAPNLGEHPDGFQVLPDMRDIKVYGNVIRGFNQNIFIEYAVANVYLYNNTLIGFRTSGTDRGINMSVRAGFTGTFLVANNDFYGFLTYSGTNGGITSAGGTVVFENNIFLNCKLVTNNGTEGASVAADNFYYNGAGVQYYDSSGTPVAIPADQFSGSASYSNPSFVNAAAYNFSLTAGSLAIATGTNLSAYFTTDAAGYTRSVPWDIGAYKWLGGGSSLSGILTIGGNASLK